jgi:hypothetical protein
MSSNIEIVFSIDKFFLYVDEMAKMMWPLVPSTSLIRK